MAVDEAARGQGNGGLGLRRDRGIKAYARIFGMSAEQVPTAIVGRVGPVYAEEVFLAAGGPAWGDPGLTDRERSMVIVAVLATLGVAGERLDTHVELALRSGASYEALTAMMTLVTNYAGQARGSQAMEAVQRVAGAGPAAPSRGP